MKLSDASKLRDALYLKKDDEKSDNSSIFLPYSRISSLLENFPLMHKMSVDRFEVHKCIAEMLKTYRLEAKDKQILASKEMLHMSESSCMSICEKKGMRESICVHCKGKLVLCGRDGDKVCTHCGIVDKSIVFGSQSYYDDDSTHNNATESEIPEWMLIQNAFGDVWKDIKISEMVDHWNAYVNIREDELACVKKFSSWMKKRASNENRVVAGFIFQYMLSKHELLNIDNLFPTIHYEQVQPLSKCANCHEKLYNQYSLSKHKCFSVGKKRKQWSLAKNQKTRMKII
jgi:hypothetical protein